MTGLELRAAMGLINWIEVGSGGSAIVARIPGLVDVKAVLPGSQAGDVSLDPKTVLIFSNLKSAFHAT